MQYGLWSELPHTGKNNPRVFNNLAIAYWQSKRFEEAMRAFLQAIEQDPGNPEFIQNLLQLLTQQRK